MRLVFVVTPAAKERLRLALSQGNVEKTMAAPVTAIVAADLEFFRRVPRVSESGEPRKSKFDDPQQSEAARDFARTNATLQGGYFLLAARAFGLDAGPMGGFDRKLVDAEFFRDSTFASIFLCNLGYADDTKARPRRARFAFDEIATLV